MRYFQFRLRNLFYVMTVTAIIVFAWTTFVRDNISVILVNERGVTIGFSDAWQHWMGMPYFDDETGDLVDRYNVLGPDAFIYEDANTGWSWWFIARVASAILGADITLHLIFWRLKRWYRPTHDDTA